MSNGAWRTPPDFFAKLHAEFGFNVDAAADDENALIGSIQPCGERPALQCPRCRPGRYYTVETDGASPEHYGAGDIVFANPPYDAATVARFVRCAAETAQRGALWVLLLNATITDSRPFHDYIWDRELNRPRDRVEVRFRKGRLAFLDTNNVPQESPRYSNMVVVMRPPLDFKAVTP